VGITAGRLVNNLNRPAAVGYVSEGQVKFSARSIGNFDLVAALEECQRRTNALINHGGHKGAAGFCLKIEDLPLIRENLALIAAEKLQPEDLADWLKIDARLDALPRLQEVEQLDLLEPFGCENPEPTFYIKDQAVEVKCGKGWTLVRTAAGMKFFTSEEVQTGAQVHAAINLRVDEYKGYQSIIGSAADVRPVICARDDLLQRYLAWRQHRQIPPWAEMIFRELGLEQQGENRKTNLFKSPTFLKYGSVKA
jgi:single-stranded-DNA-specific exonuclease